MRMRMVGVVGLLLLLSLVAVGVTASAQARAYIPVREPKVISGADLGVRVHGMRGAVPVATMVIRVNGEWVEIDEGPRNAPRFIEGTR